MKKNLAIIILVALSLAVSCFINRNTLQAALDKHHLSGNLSANDTVNQLGLASTNDNIVFPQDGGVINVKNAPYNAKGDGVTDDTAAIQQALNDYPNGNKIIYLPNGTYLVSNQLRWPNAFRNGKQIEGWRDKRTILQGQSRNGTIIKLKNKAFPFSNRATPKAVIWTGTAPAQRFRNAIRNLTLDTGRENPGAIGIQFIANNQGGIRDVTIQSGDGQGRSGLDMQYTDQVGPCLIKNLKVIGFEYGIHTGNYVASQTFENITLLNQLKYGFYNAGQVINIHNLTSINNVPSVYNDVSLMTIINAKLIGISQSLNKPAIINKSLIFARNIRTYQYQTSINNQSGIRQNVNDSVVAEFVSHPIHSLLRSKIRSSLFPTPIKSLNLPISETPEIPWDSLNQWVSPTQYGAKPNDNQDDSAAIQAAIDSGKTTLYFPNGIYNIKSTIYIRKNIRRIIGLEAEIVGKGIFNFTEGSAPVVQIERFDGFGSGIVNTASRTLVLSSMGLLAIRSLNQTATYSNTGSGDLYIEDVVGGPWTFNQQKVWARQLNVENPGTKIVNNGGTLWILGLKTEREGIVINTKAGGKTELAGGLVYSTSEPKKTPMFINDHSAISLTVSECNFNKNYFTTIVSEIRQGVKTNLHRGDTYRFFCNGSTIPLYVGF